jgi:hypothetical protein
MATSNQHIHQYTDLLLHNMGRAWPVIAPTLQYPEQNGRPVPYGALAFSKKQTVFLFICPMTGPEYRRSNSLA